jgi:hypothetical protein
VLNPTPPVGLTDDQGRPYFLWDCDLTLEQFERGLHDPELRAYLVRKLMRQANQGRRLNPPVGSPGRRW